MLPVFCKPPPPGNGNFLHFVILQGFSECQYWNQELAGIGIEVIVLLQPKNPNAISLSAFPLELLVFPLEFIAFSRYDRLAIHLNCPSVCFPLSHVCVGKLLAGIILSVVGITAPSADVVVVQRCFLKWQK
eukprot:scaffold792_cov84-Cylindrotheca_fusiformis.AAC.11